MTLSQEQWLLLGLLAAGWLYFSDSSKTAANPAPATVDTGSTDKKAQVIDYGLPSWQDLGSKFNTGD